MESQRFLVHDISKLELPERQFDMIFSEGVFEHIPEEDLKVIVAKMSRWLKRSYRACSPIFTSIWGGHCCGGLYSNGEPAGRRIEP
jgi:cyclopropane fatty-acyl-phospholipid synthase-like methyltransferase